MVSHNALPEQRDLLLEVYRRTDAPRLRVQLERLKLTGIGGGGVNVYAYRVGRSAVDVDTCEPAELPLEMPNEWRETV